MKKTPQEILQEILLNKVIGLEWYYFQVRLSDEKSLKIKMTFKKLIKHISANKLGQLEYDGKNSINPTELFVVISNYLNEVPDAATKVIKRIFDTNQIANHADIHGGFIGRLNIKETERRKNKYDKIRKKEYPIRNNREYVILAEGDSWFQFPRTLGFRMTKDIVYHLANEKKFLVRSLASAGDWLSNILRARDYIEELPKLSPDVLLVSGGGNDMVGEDRIAQMVSIPDHNIRSDNFQETLDELFTLRKGARDFKEHIYLKGQKYIEEEFMQFLNLIFIQYYLLFKNLSGVDKYKNMLIFTQGYDFCHPRLTTPKNGLIHRLYEKRKVSGKWISLPLSTKGIDNPDDQTAIIYFMIHEYNELLIPIARHFENVYHLDCRGTAPHETDWIDELHLKADKYKLIANTIRDCILDEGDLRDDPVIRILKDKEFSCQ